MQKTFFLFLALLLPVAGFAAFTPTDVPVSPEGLRATVDLPAELHHQNTSGRDGLGLCVFTSFEVECEWMGYTQMRGFQQWMESKPGGGWPGKLDRMVEEFCAEKGVNPPPYIQHTGGDEELLELAIKTRRGACVTYAGMDDFYNGDIAHMVVLSEFGRTDEAAIMDNNRAGRWLWMTRKEFSFRWKMNTAGQGWAVVLLGSPPPPSEQGVDPKPTPKPKPKPKPWRPFRPWLRVDLSDGSTLWKLYTEDGVLEGVWDYRGWHKAVTPDGWTPDTSGQPPVDPPVNRVAESIVWHTDYNKAQTISKESGKPLLVVFSSSNCKWCRVLERGALSDPTVVAKINALFVPVKVTDAGAEYLKAFNVKAFPTSVVVSAGGEQIVDFLEGAAEPIPYNMFLQSTIKPRNVYSVSGGFGTAYLSRDEAHKLIDDVDFWFITAVVESDAEKAALLTRLYSGELASVLTKVHLNVYTKDFWAGSRVKHKLNVQKPFAPGKNPVIWFKDGLTDEDFEEALVQVGLLKPKAPVAPEPREPAKPIEPKPVDPVAPVVNPGDPEPVRPSPEPTSIPLWAFWGGVGGVSYVFYRLIIVKG